MTAPVRSLDKLHRDKIVEIRKGNMFYADPKLIEEEEGFNPRNYEDPDTVQHIRGLADAYKAGSYVPPIVVQVLDGRIMVRDGHCRRRGMLLAIEEGADLGQQPMTEFRGDQGDADALILTSQSGKKLAPLEVAFMYNRMLNRGKTVTEIAKLVGKTGQHVANYLTIHELPDEIKGLIKQEVVSATLALKTYNEMGTKAVDALKDGVEIVLKSGNKKLTQKRLDAATKGANPNAPKRPNISKSVAFKMADQVRNFGNKLADVEFNDEDTATVTLSRDEVEAILALRDELPANEEEKVPENQEALDLPDNEKQD